MEEKVKLLFLGPPGAGKGTMASRLSERIGIPHISTGDIMRAAIRNETALGKDVKTIVESGGLVPDNLTSELVKERLAEKDARNGFILDGFPRTIGQADTLKTISEIDRAVHFILANEEIITRLSGRRIHKASGRTYHVLFNPPKVENRDDISGEELITRPDDSEEAISRRLELYREQTAPLIEYYEQLGLVLSVDSRPKPDIVFGNLVKALQSP